MTVRKLFWDDPYARSCEARVASVARTEVRLDRTVAYAFSGGQHSDAGTIGGCAILAARTDGADIVYTLDEAHGLAVGDSVTVEIDWPRRYRIMRLHFAAEIVLELIGQRFERPRKAGADVGEGKARLDFEWPSNIAATFPVLSAEFAALVAADLPIASAFTDEPAGRRVWSVEGFATVPCGGTHLSRTGEVGEVALRRANPGRGLERIEIRLADPDVPSPAGTPHAGF